MRVYVQFIQKEVPDTSAQILEQCSRRLNLLLTHWKTVAQFFSNNKVHDIILKVIFSLCFLLGMF